MPPFTHTPDNYLLRTLVNDDQARLIELPPAEIQAFTLLRMQEYRTKIEQLNGFLTELKKVHNAASPILRMLPKELLMEIFRFINPTSRADIRFGHVCRSWRDVLQSTPEFWAELVSVIDATVRSETDWECFLSMLALSFPRSCALFLEGGRLLCMPDARTHLSRITSLVITFEARHLADHLPHLSDFFTVGLPRLEELAITISGSCSAFTQQVGSNAGALYLTSYAQVPRLRVLRTNGCLLTAALIPPSLRHVTLIGGEPYSGDIRWEVHSFPALFGSLAQCPNLETLELVHCMPCDFDVLPHPYPTVQLASLRKLCISDHTELVRTFLECVAFPVTTRLEISNLANDWRNAYDNVLPQATPLPVLPYVERMAVQFDHPQSACTFRLFAYPGFVEECEGGCEGGAERVTIRTQWMYLVEDAVLADLRGMLALTQPVLELELHLDGFASSYRDRREAATQWALLLAAFPNLVRLIIIIRNGVEGLVDALSNEDSVSLLVYMEQLTIRCWDDGENTSVRLAAAMNARAQAGCAVTQWTFDGTAFPPQVLEWDAPRLEGVTQIQERDVETIEWHTQMLEWNAQL
ncbi:hypothetical protein BC628DRAFT_1382943 [Trametes gibbosa]|nr:hypothetical protein BC628DRAFT_1382943 [Trametes gibbosa]